MMTKNISDELVGLVYNVQLNDSKWWNKTVQSFILETLYHLKREKRSIFIDHIKEHHILASVSHHDLNTELEALIAIGSIHQIDGDLILSEKVNDQIDNQSKEIKDLEEYFDKKIDDLLLDKYMECIDFCSKEEIKELLLSIIFELGAYVFNIVTGRMHIKDTHAFESYITKQSPKNREIVAGLLLEILDVNDKKIRALFYRKLNAFFCLKAGSMQKEDLYKVTTLKKDKPEFIVFIDTNFLFSLLDIHENPANEIAATLFETLKGLNNNVEIKLYISQITLKEAVRVIDKCVEDISRIQFTGSIIKSIEEYHLNGIMQRWINLVKEAKINQTIGDYFEPYRKNLLSIIREYGIELYNEKQIEKYSMDKRVLSDIALQIEFEEKRGKRTKSYEQHVHDISLWYFLNDKRPEYIESVTDAKYWLLTVDNRFLGYDEFRKNSNGNRYNICMHPSVFLSIVQFWIPKSDDLEKLLIEYIRQPVFFYEYDESLEKGLVKILQALSRFEEVEKVSEEVISQMLLDKELRRRIGGSNSVDEEIEFVKDALLIQHKELETKLKEKESELILLKEITVKTETELEKQIRKANELEEENKKLKEEDARRVRFENKRKHIKRVRKQSIFHLFVSFLILASVIGANIILNKYLPEYKAYTIIISITGGFILSLIDRTRLKSSFKAVLHNRKYIEEITKDI